MERLEQSEVNQNVEFKIHETLPKLVNVTVPTPAIQTPNPTLLTHESSSYNCQDQRSSPSPSSSPISGSLSQSS